MSGIAERYGVSLSSLTRWNGMSRARPLRVGEKLRLTAPEPKRHRVTSGESLSGVARRYKVDVSDLMEWNDITRPRGLKIGEVLLVSAAS
jgi:membrane-bound lytic murein transglycosylase D